MNRKFLNTVNLDGGVIIKKGSGGGGNSGGGGGDIPVIGDGKTYLYITIAAEGRMAVPLYFKQTKAKGVVVDWGDGTTLTYWDNTVDTKKNYERIGDYIIALEVVDGELQITGSSNGGIMGSKASGRGAYPTMLRRIEIGNDVTSVGDKAFYECSGLSSVVIPNSVTSIGISAFYNCYSIASVVIPNSVASIGNYAFAGCYSLSSVVIPNSVTSIGNGAFNKCYSLSSVVIPNSVTSIGSDTFNNCYSLSSVVIPNSVTSIGSNAFNNCYGIAFFDFRTHTSVPTLSYTNAFNNIASDCKIVVPDELYDTWIAATNWSSYASKIVKASEFNG